MKAVNSKPVLIDSEIFCSFDQTKITSNKILNTLSCKFVAMEFFCIMLSIIKVSFTHNRLSQ